LALFLKESFKMAMNNLRQRKLRSALTIIGIVIGIAAVVSLISTGIGASKFIAGQLGQLGANKLFIGPNTAGRFGPQSSTQPLTDDDIDEIKKIQGIDTVAGVLFKSMPVKFNDETRLLNIFGVDPKVALKTFGEIQGFQISKGRWIQQGDKFSVNIGPMIASKTFSKNIEVGNKIEINEIKFKVVGITKETGQQNNDIMITIPIDTLREISGGGKEYSIMLASVNDINKIEDIAKLVQKRLDDIHGEKVMSVLTTSQLVSNISNIFSSLSVLLSAIAAISLLVAAIGISNTMLITVMERTREIGIMKAVGATNWNVLEIFLMEAAVTGLIGGIFGVILGAVVSEIINGMSGLFGMPLVTAITPELIVGAIVLAVGVGTIAGFYPARRAAKLHPIDALRYE